MLLADRQGALEAFRSALAVDEGAGDAHASLALAHFMNGDTQHARAHLESAEKIDANDETTRMARMVLAGEADSAGRDALLKQVLSQWSPRA